MSDIRQTEQYANYLSDLGWIVERIEEVNYFIKKFPIIGSVIKIQRPEVVDLKTIKDLSNRYRAFQVIVEPKTEYQVSCIKNQGFKPSSSAYLPTKTLHLDLALSTKRLISSMKKDARYALRKCQEANVQCRIENNPETFRKEWKKAVGWKLYVPPLSQLTVIKKSFKDNSLFLLDKNTASGAIFLFGGKTAYYWQAFTDNEGRRSKVQYYIIWNAIKWAKKKGAKVFDFEGIYDERFPNNGWLGFTHFKKSFGGYEVKYPGAFVKNRLLDLI